MNRVKHVLFLVLLIVAGDLVLTSSIVDNADKKKLVQEYLKTNVEGKSRELTLVFEPGKHHNHPTMAVWIEDVRGAFIQELYVTQSVATGIFAHGAKSVGDWSDKPGEARRPASLPYFLHKRNILADDGTYLPTPQQPIPDAYSGATPKAGFELKTRADNPLSDKFVLLCEVNQPWDWNEYWNNTLYPDDFDYKTSCQPAIVYAVTIDLNNLMDYYMLNPIGHSHFSGKDGKLYTDLTTLSTALQIFKSIKVELKP